MAELYETHDDAVGNRATEQTLLQLRDLLEAMTAAVTAAQEAVVAAVEELSGGGKTFVPSIVLTADDATQVLAVADATRQYHVAGVEITEIEAGVTSLKLVDSDGTTLLDFGAFAAGGSSISLPRRRDLMVATAMAGKGVSLASVGGCVKGNVWLAWETA